MRMNAVLVAILMVCAFLVVGQLYLVIPLNDAIMRDFHVSSAQAALTGPAFGLAYAVGFLVFGTASDRYGRLPVLIGGLGMLALATVLVALAPGFQLLVAARALQGATASLFPPTALALAADRLPAGLRPVGVAFISFAFLCSAPLSQFLAASSGEGLASLMFMLAPAYLLGALALAWIAVRQPERRTGAGGASAIRLGVLFRNPVIVSAWGAAVTVLFGFVVLHSAVQAMAASEGPDPQLVRLVGIPALAVTFAAIPSMRRYGASGTAQIGFVFSIAAFALLLAVGSEVLHVASIMATMGIALSAPGLIALLSEAAGDTHRGFTLAIYSFLLFLGASLAPPAVQYAMAGAGAGSLWLLPLSLSVLALGGLVFCRSKPARLSFMNRRRLL